MKRYTHCPYCGTKYAPNTGQTEHRCMQCRARIWRHSSPTGSAVIVKDDHILLGKRGNEPSKGMWDVIGGFCNYEESSEDAAIREAKEETGLDVEIQAYLGCWMDVYGQDEESTMNIAYLVTPVGGSEQPNDDIVELQWFHRDEIPDDIAFVNGQKMIQAWLKLIN